VAFVCELFQGRRPGAAGVYQVGFYQRRFINFNGSHGFNDSHCQNPQEKREEREKKMAKFKNQKTKTLVSPVVS
jgi:hypothetical protein